MPLWVNVTLYHEIDIYHTHKKNAINMGIYLTDLQKKAPVAIMLGSRYDIKVESAVYTERNRVFAWEITDLLQLYYDKSEL